MKIGIMQPYAFPYIGYYQLVFAVDKFVFLDDVNYIKRGWINRNNIQVNGSPSLFTIPVENASLTRKISEHRVASTYDDWRRNFYKTLEYSYKHAQFYREVVDVVHRTLDDKENLSHLCIESVLNVCDYMEVKRDVMLSSTLDVNTKREQRILDICKKLNGNTYINPIGGQTLYEKGFFESNDIELNFLQTNYMSNLSIIDVLMHHGKSSRNFLQEFSLV